MNKKTISVNASTWQRLNDMSKNISDETGIFTSIGTIVDFMVGSLSHITEDMLVRRFKPSISLSDEEVAEILKDIHLSIEQEG